MLVTLFTDGSFCHRTGAGGWGCWAKSSRGKTFRGGPIKTTIKSSNTAELYAVANGIHLILRTKIAVPGDTVLVQSDSSHVVGLLAGLDYNTLDEEKEALKFIREVSLDNDLEIISRHVRGHQSNGGRRGYVNNRCDRLAAAGLDEAILNMGKR